MSKTASWVTSAWARLALVLALALTARKIVAQQSLGQTSQTETLSAAVEKNVVYGSVEDLKLRLDVYAPVGSGTELRRAIILIHGGGWSSLDKSTMERMGQFLARSGFVAFSVDYRLLQDAKNRWPAQLDDVQRAVRWVRANAAKYRIDPEHMGAFGHSAGAQLAALLGMEETRDNSDQALAKCTRAECRRWWM